MISRSDMPRTRLGSQERGFISKGMALFPSFRPPGQSVGGRPLYGIPLFPLARFHADLIFGLAGLSRIIRRAGALLIATLFATARVFGPRRSVSAPKPHEDQNDANGSHDDLLSSSVATHCTTRASSRDDAGQIQDDAGARAGSDGRDHADLEPEDGDHRRDGERKRPGVGTPEQDRKSTRLNSSHVRISYAVFCLKKKKKQ